MTIRLTFLSSFGVTVTVRTTIIAGFANQSFLTLLLSGSEKQKVAPFSLSILFSAHILPSWASTMLLEINKPSSAPPVSERIKTVSPMFLC
jgi:hypothetical protein